MMLSGHFMNCLRRYCPLWIPKPGESWHAIESAFSLALESPRVVKAPLIEARFDGQEEGL
jgi:hypothetical protein